jgi:dTDP-4-amino-4,6-dideoxygalactose transaminase
MKIPFNKPYVTGKETQYLAQACEKGMLSGDGPFTVKCQKWLETNSGTKKALLTHSCTAALEISAIVLDIQPGDEVIMPSFTFVSTANAFVLRGAVPVFVDIRPDTLNINELLIEAAITPKTRAIVPVHYAGVACEMDSIMAIANKHGLKVIEDAAQGMMATYKGKSLGSIGHLGAYSFHETKNIISGEGGALLINDMSYINKAEICREKGTDRSRFFRGEVDKYTWQEVGSSYLPGELIAAFLWAQLEEAEYINAERRKIWDYYHESLALLEQQGLIERPTIPAECIHNAHMYYVLLSPNINRDEVLTHLSNEGVKAVFHYVPLHSSPAGLKYCRISGHLQVTDDCASRLIRLPLWIGITRQEQDKVIEMLSKEIKKATIAA